MKRLTINKNFTTSTTFYKGIYIVDDKEYEFTIEYYQDNNSSFVDEIKWTGDEPENGDEILDDIEDYFAQNKKKYDRD